MNNKIYEAELVCGHEPSFSTLKLQIQSLIILYNT